MTGRKDEYLNNKKKEKNASNFGIYKSKTVTVVCKISVMIRAQIRRSKIVT